MDALRGMLFVRVWLLAWQGIRSWSDSLMLQQITDALTPYILALPPYVLQFRRVLLLAMISRFLCIPVMIWSDPVWCQFVGDTLPEMIFATAWTMLVTFFVQVVAIATGTGSNTSPSIVISMTAYVVYMSLIVLELFNSVASVLLYALLCCIYAALLGTIAYFLPRLLTLLRETLSLHASLAIRLAICAVLCVVLFGAHTIGFARIVVAPPQKVYWWWKYGCLEVLPAITFLLLLKPTSTHHVHKDRSGSGGSVDPWKRVSSHALIRVDSTGSHHSGGGHPPRKQSPPASEHIPLKHSPVAYGAASQV